MTVMAINRVYSPAHIIFDRLGRCYATRRPLRGLYMHYLARFRMLCSASGMHDLSI